MIISASRRTDIPAAYPEWFINRIREGFVYLRNYRNPTELTKIPLNRDSVESIVFWTKNAAPLAHHLHELKDWNYYFQHTITSYDRSIEPNIPSKTEIIDSFVRLSQQIGPDRMVWRYDPVLLSPQFDIDYHKTWFDVIAKRLAGHTNRCVVSILDPYPKAEQTLSKLKVRIPTTEEAFDLFRHFAETAATWGIQVEACAEKTDFRSVGVNPTKCIDDNVVSKACGSNFTAPKDRSQRAACGCIQSIDIGSYNTCPHGCVMCYATGNHSKAADAWHAHDPASPLLCDKPHGNETIKEYI